MLVLLSWSCAISCWSFWIQLGSRAQNTFEIVTEDPRQKVLTEGPKNKVLTEDPRQKVLTEVPKQKILAKDIRQTVLTEGPKYKVLTENPGQKVLALDPEHKILTEDSWQKALTKGIKQKVQYRSSSTEGPNKKVLARVYLMSSWSNTEFLKNLKKSDHFMSGFVAGITLPDFLVWLFSSKTAPENQFLQCSNISYFGGPFLRFGTLQVALGSVLGPSNAVLEGLGH